MPLSSGDKNAILSFSSNDPDENPKNISLLGIGVAKPPDISVSPAPCHFENIPLGSSSEQPILIYNKGGSELKVFTTSIIGTHKDQFSIKNGAAPFSVVPDLTHTLLILFEPSSQSDKNAALRISSNDPDENPLDVSLLGSVDVLVRFESFTATQVDNNVLLSWQTSFEKNNLGFNVHQSYKSRNGGWENIAFVKGANSSSTSQYYEYLDKSITTPGKYFYRLEQIDKHGNCSYSPTVEIEFNSPEKFALHQNYPNPFNPSTTIAYELKNDAHVTIKVYDVLGETVATILQAYKKAGSYKLKFNAENLHAGIYIYKIKAGSFTQYRKMTLLK